MNSDDKLNGQQTAKNLELHEIGPRVDYTITPGAKISSIVLDLLVVAADVVGIILLLALEVTTVIPFVMAIIGGVLYSLWLVYNYCQYGKPLLIKLTDDNFSIQTEGKYENAGHLHCYEYPVTIGGKSVSMQQWLDSWEMVLLSQNAEQVTNKLFEKLQRVMDLNYFDKVGGSCGFAEKNGKVYCYLHFHSERSPKEASALLEKAGVEVGGIDKSESKEEQVENESPFYSKIEKQAQYIDDGKAIVFSSKSGHILIVPTKRFDGFYNFIHTAKAEDRIPVMKQMIWQAKRAYEKGLLDKFGWHVGEIVYSRVLDEKLAGNSTQKQAHGRVDLKPSGLRSQLKGPPAPYDPRPTDYQDYESLPAKLLSTNKEFKTREIEQYQFEITLNEQLKQEAITLKQFNKVIAWLKLTEQQRKQAVKQYEKDRQACQRWNDRLLTIVEA